jgi:HSP20 family protein
MPVTDFQSHAVDLQQRPRGAGPAMDKPYAMRLRPSRATPKEVTMGMLSLFSPRSLTGTGRLFDDQPYLSLQREIDRVFNSFLTGDATAARTLLAPRMDVIETDKAYEITAELPGLEEKDVDVTVEENVLTLRGEKKAEREEKDDKRHVVERSYGAFARSLILPDGITAADIAAHMEKGVLKVTIPKPAKPEPKPQKIAVRSAP